MSSKGPGRALPALFQGAIRKEIESLGHLVGLPAARASINASTHTTAGAEASAKKLPTAPGRCRACSPMQGPPPAACGQVSARASSRRACRRRRRPAVEICRAPAARVGGGRRRESIARTCAEARACRAARREEIPRRNTYLGMVFRAAHLAWRGSSAARRRKEEGNKAPPANMSVRAQVSIQSSDQQPTYSIKKARSPMGDLWAHEAAIKENKNQICQEEEKSKERYRLEKARPLARKILPRCLFLIGLRCQKHWGCCGP